MRTLINVLAGLTILVGGWVLVSPGPVSADPDQACCEVAGKKCCGDRCEITGNDCKACSGLGCIVKG